jgi:DNA-3-methyladenine glycosylase
VIKLKRDFFLQDSVLVAKQLLYKKLHFYGKSVIITETECYSGMGDPACHARFGQTQRNFPMFGECGFSYVYLIYGIYYCLNFVTEKKGYPAAILIRGGHDSKAHYDGPGKLCRYLGITKEHNNVDIVSNDNFFIEDINFESKYIASSRIGIKAGLDKQWRFLAEKIV